MGDISLTEISSDPTVVVGGRGMIARQRIERGTLILQEMPLNMVPVNPNHTETPGNLDQFYISQALPGSKTLISKVNALTRAKRTVFDNSSGPAPPAGALVLTERQGIVGRFIRNSWAVNALGGRRAYLVVYNLMSLLNHSCIPNAVVDVWEEKLEGDTKAPPFCQAKLIATRLIPEGSEILLSYIDHRYEDHTVRNILLQSNYGLSCTCSGCHPDGTATDTTERALASQYHNSNLGMDSELTMADIDRRIKRNVTYIRLLQHVGTWDGHIAKACYNLACLHIGQLDYRKAMLAASTGLNVVTHLYDDRKTVALRSNLGEELINFHAADSSLGRQITGTGSFYPLS